MNEEMERAMETGIIQSFGVLGFKGSGSGLDLGFRVQGLGF